MKKVYYRNILGNNPRKREVSIEEISDRSDNKIIKKWVCKYFVKEKYSAENERDLKKWIYMKKQNGYSKDCHILRQCDTRTGKNKIICKVLGDFFVICGRTVFEIVYVNELKIQVGD